MKSLLPSLLLVSALSANTYVDQTTHLEWQDNADAASVTKKWNGAKQYCEDLKLDGKEDWRLPEYRELLGITDKSRYNPAIKNGFRNVANASYWSSSSNADDSGNAWLVYFDYGLTYRDLKDNSRYVRCVRDSTSTFDSFSALYEKNVAEAMESLPKPPVSESLTKGEFEKQREFEIRIEATKKANATAIEQYKRDYQAYYPKAKREAMKKTLEMYYGKPKVTNLAYDPENELFGADVRFENAPSQQYKIVIPMPPSQAAGFKSSFGSITPIALFDHSGDNVTFQTIKFVHGGKTYMAQLSDRSIGSANVQVAQLDTQAPVMAMNAPSVSINATNSPTFDTSKLVSLGDLDDLLSKTKALPEDPKKWLFVIGVEEYKYTDNIAYATRSAQMFVKAAQKSLGVSGAHTYALLNANATATEIKTKLKLMLRNVKEGDKIYFYYNGHGVPAANQQNEPYILANDMMSDFITDEPGFMMKQIYKELSDSKAASVVAVVDSCFSGSTDGKSIQKGIAATRVKPKEISFDKSKMVVLTAGRDTQFSNGYNQKGHRLFSYFVIEELLKGERNIKELYGKVFKNTKETTLANYGDTRVQEPTLDGNEGLQF